jgi:BirA family biotin operon repressor/biotin-[acetyl-CoA-carboxylase] ligase
MFARQGSLVVNRESLLEQLQTATLGRPLVYFDTTDSTNTQAMRAVLAGTAPHGAAFVAARQTSGRGMDGTRWVSPEPTGLWMSLVVHFGAVLAGQGPPLALLPAIAVAQTLRDGCGIDAHLKWPNDVLVGPRKIAGILVESVARQKCLTAVIGVGVNLSQPSFVGELEAVAVSALMLGKKVLIPFFFGRLMASFEELWNQPHSWPARWAALSRMTGRRVELRFPAGSQWCTADGITEEGYLQVRDDDGRPRIIISRAGLDVRVDWDS